MAERFEDERLRIEDFSDEFLVVCPDCRGCARVVPREPGATGLFAPRRLLCTGCGHIAEWKEERVVQTPGSDWYLGRPL